MAEAEDFTAEGAEDRGERREVGFHILRGSLRHQR